ncbi:MAG: hypothetical protein O2779_04745 [Nanoarchaeota archaeon]|nr:hypothetical protein [Nanoarchaeota archaeon]
MKIKFSIVLALVLLSSIVSAFPFGVLTEAVESVITPNQQAKYLVTIQNNLSTEEEVRLKTLDFPLWDITTDPLTSPITVTVPPKGKSSIEIFIKPVQQNEIGAYNVNLQVKNERLDQEKTVPLRVTIVSPEPGKYQDTVIASLILEEQINPSKEVPIKIRLDNQNTIDYESLKITVESNHFNHEVDIPLGKKEKKTISFTKTIDAQTPPQLDTVVLKVMYGDRVLDTKVQRIQINKFQRVSPYDTAESTILKQTRTILYKNEGNVAYDGSVKIPTTLIERLFLSSSPRGTFTKTEEGRFLMLQLALEPGEEFTWRITKNYLALVAIFIFLSIGALFYFSYRAKVDMKKLATQIEFREGGVSEMKVMINIHNRGKTTVKEIEVLDRIPNIADLQGDIAIGTLRPIKIKKHNQKGTILKWVIDELGPGDERVITYKIKSHLPIIGEFKLAKAVGSYNVNHKKQIIHSNSLDISPQE